MPLLDHVTIAANRLAGRVASRRLLFVSGAAVLVLAGLLFATSGRGSVAAVAQQCGQPAPDVRFTTSPEGVQEFLVACGEAGRSAYRDLQVVDLAYPAALGLFLASALALLGRRGVGRARFAHLVPLVPLVPLTAAACDYLENVAAWTLLARFPAPAPGVARVLGAASAGKQVLSWASVLLLAVSLVGALVARRPTKSADSAESAKSAAPTEHRALRRAS